MEDPLHRGLPFEVGGVSQFFDLGALLNAESLFDRIDLNVQALPVHDGGELFNDIAGFDLPELDHPDVIAEENLQLPFEDAPIDSGLDDLVPDHSQDDRTDVWDLEAALGAENAHPRLRTWEAFDNKEVSSCPYLTYISEAGPKAFDAALSVCRQQHTCVAVLPQDAVLRAYCSLIMGRSSIYCVWEPSKRSFTATLPDASVSGLSIDCSTDFTASMAEYGTLLRNLRDYSETTHSVGVGCSAVKALKHCFADILDTVEASVAAQLSSLKTLLRLQALVERPRQILDLLAQLKDACEATSDDDEGAISKLSDCIHLMVQTSNDHVALLRAIITRVSAPWLQSLASELGLTDQTGYRSPNIGPWNNGTAPPEIDASMVDRQTDWNHPGTILSDRDRTLVRETRANLRLLRKHLPEEGVSMPMCGLDSISPHAAPQNPIHDALEIGPSIFIWTDDLAHDAYLEVLDSRMSSVPDGFDGTVLRNDVQGCTDLALRHQTPTELDPRIELDAGFHFDPLERVRPLLEAQSRNVNEMLLRCLFADCELRRHLEALHGFFLLGNSDFITRLSIALFSSDTQGAERRRGAVPTAEPLGLKLDTVDAQRWPPASSELRLTLMDVLRDAYKSLAPDVDKHRHALDLPGGFSFVIRELPDEEIEQVLDSSSLYALDFLGLQYTAPAPLGTILSPGSLKHYDEIFRQLLRLLRLKNLTASLQRRYSARSASSSDNAAQYVIEAHHVVSVVLSHCMDLGIAASWTTFMHSVDETESVTCNGTTTELPLTSVSDLQIMHDRCLEKIRSVLYMRRRQENMRNQIDAVFSEILHATAVLMRGESLDTRDFTKRFGDFRTAVKSLVGTLQATIEKPPRDQSKHMTDIGEADMAALLLGKLDCNGFYRDARQYS